MSQHVAWASVRTVAWPAPDSVMQRACLPCLLAALRSLHLLLACHRAVVGPSPPLPSLLVLVCPRGQISLHRQCLRFSPVQCACRRRRRRRRRRASECTNRRRQHWRQRFSHCARARQGGHSTENADMTISGIWRGGRIVFCSKLFLYEPLLLRFGLSGKLTICSRIHGGPIAA